MPAGRTRQRIASALGPAGFACLLVLLTALAPARPARADDAPAAHPSYKRAYIALGAGAALTGLSFVLAEQADRDYEEYLTETDPALLEDAYQSAKKKDRLAAAALIAGQAGLVLGIYWRFLHHPEDDAKSTSPSWGVRPRFDEDGAGVAFDVRF
jgi:hypothetical protein